GIAPPREGLTSQDGEHSHPDARGSVHQGQPVPQPSLEQRTDRHHQKRPLHQGGGFRRGELENLTDHHRQRHRIGHQKDQPLHGGDGSSSPTAPLCILLPIPPYLVFTESASNQPPGTPFHRRGTAAIVAPPALGFIIGPSFFSF